MNTLDRLRNQNEQQLNLSKSVIMEVMLQPKFGACAHLETFAKNWSP